MPDLDNNISFFAKNSNDQIPSSDKDISEETFKAFFQDNLQMILWVLIAVFMLKILFIESFQIPTTSMEPTLVGDPRCGDRILVNKIIYQYQELQRWDVIVFQYPLNQSISFIKRLVGLPGENLSIKNGNIYINEKILRKPPSIQKLLQYSIFDLSKNAYEEYWITQEKNWNYSNKELKLVTEDLSFLTYSKSIVNEFQPFQDDYFYNRKNPARIVGGSHRVGEIELDFSVLPKKNGTVVSQLRSGNFRWMLELSCDPKQSSHIFQYLGESTEPSLDIVSPIFLSSLQISHIRFQNFDEMLEVFVNQEKIFELDYALPLKESSNITYEVSIKLGGKSGEFVFSNIRLYRDIYYSAQRYLWSGVENWQIPSGCYFVLGDNSSDSVDSREWSKFQIILKNGISLEGDARNLPNLENNDEYSFIDKFGIQRNILRDKIREQPGMNIASPFVERHLIIGKAWLVAWPPVRIKKIH